MLLARNWAMKSLLLCISDRQPIPGVKCNETPERSLEPAYTRAFCPSRLPWGFSVLYVRGRAMRSGAAWARMFLDACQIGKNPDADGRL